MRSRPYFQLVLQTLSLVVGFMVWVILSALIPFIRQDIQLSSGQLAWVTAIPVILGSLLRIAFGYWANRFGSKWLFTISFFILLLPIYYISVAHTFVDLMLGGLLLGIGGAVFSLGVTSLPKYFDKEKHGLVNGIYGSGNIGTAITTFFAPILAGYFSWNGTVKLFLILVALFALLNFLFGDPSEPKSVTPLVEQIKGVYKNEKLWFLCLFYFITFGSFVAFTVYLPNFLVAHFHLNKVDAGIRTAGFIALATVMRPLGGWLGDKFNSFKILMFVFGGLTVAGVLLSFMPNIVYYTIGCLTIAICAGTGNGTIFKLVPMYFTKQAGIVNGIVSALGGLGGFFPPLILTVLYSITGHYAIGFMALSEFALASLILVIWMYYQDQLIIKERIFESTVEGIMVTDKNGVIQAVNPAFTILTGYEPQEAIGKTPSILKSGKHEERFYANMWDDIEETGFWQGEILNRRKNGDVYPEWLTISEIKNDGGEIIFYAAMFSDLSKQVETEKEGR